MNTNAIHHWHALCTYLCVITLCMLGCIHTASAADDTTLTLEPHCVFGELDDDWMFGPIPDIEPLIDLGEGHCKEFAVEDPRTLRTEPLSKGSILDIDIVVKNPDKEKIQRVRSWLNYDTTVLEGKSVQINEVFAIVAPGEEDFNSEDGFVMADATAEDGDEPSIERIAVARIQFKVLETPSAGTIISFYDVQAGGHTEVFIKSETEDDGESVLTSDPGTLHVVFGNNTGDNTADDDDGLLDDGEPCQIDSQCKSDQCVDGICGGETNPLPNGSTCTENDECKSGLCDDGICASDDPLLPNGSPCSTHNVCLSGYCMNGLCQERAFEPPAENTETDESDTTENSTAFSLLQVQNLRATTEGTSVFLGWDPLETSRLKAYNMYYGTTTGQYIQRKTIEGSMQSLVLHSLPAGTRYYFAIRAVSTDDEESAFSNEVSVEVGNAASSTAPLSANVTFDDPTDLSNLEPANPVQNTETVPGETGIPSMLVILLFASAVIGTIFASRRQLIVAPQPPRS